MEGAGERRHSPPRLLSYNVRLWHHGAMQDTSQIRRRAFRSRNVTQARKLLALAAEIDAGQFRLGDAEKVHA